MKLLGWMNHKFRRNSGVPLEAFTIGHSCTCLMGKSSRDDQQFYSKTKYGTEPFRPSQRDHLRKAGVEAAQVDEEDSSSAIDTLGSDPNIPDPSTPTFSISVTENELKLINDELEKVLGAEDNEEGQSKIQTIEDLDTNGNGISVCPLLCYLLGSAIELSETTTVAKKEHGTSLLELFQMTKITEENLGSKSAVHIMKEATAGNIDSASAETKLHKISHMFHEKVDPERPTTTYKHGKPEKNENKEDILYDGGHMLADDDIIIYPQRAVSKNIWNYKSQSNPPQFALSCNGSNGNRECWIKTDAEYLVLEL